VRILKDGIRGVGTEIRTQQIERSWSPYKIGSIFNVELNNNSDKRSGGFLSTLINRNQKEKDRLSFSFKGNLDFIYKPFEVILTFKISSHNLDLAFIDEILFKDLNDGTIFLKVGNYDNREPTLKIDFAYFVNTVLHSFNEGKDFYHRLSEMNEILKKGGEKNEQKVLRLLPEFENDFNVKVIVKKEEDVFQLSAYYPDVFELGSITVEEEKKLLGLLKKNQLYDFVSFINYKKEGLKTLEEILLYYNEDNFDTKLILFSKDLVDFFSKIEWKLLNDLWPSNSIHNLLIFEREDVVVDCLSLKKLCYLLSAVNPIFPIESRIESVTKEKLVLFNFEWVK
jgi:hypothetical protein